MSHFPDAELGLTAATPAAHRAAMYVLRDTILTPIREHVGAAVYVNRDGMTLRGWRPSGSVGVATSQHFRGEAADIDLGGKVDIVPLFRWIAWESGLPFGQIIIERRKPGRWSWLHVSLGLGYRAPPRCGQVLYSPDGQRYVSCTPTTVLPA